MARFIPLWVLLSAALGVAFLAFAPPIRQDQSYFAFADTRAVLGIPNFWNVVSNIPFAFLGAAGLVRFRDAATRILFAGSILTAFGSAYFHHTPNADSLVWDRLPMTLIFMSLTSIAAGQVLGEKRSRRLLSPLLAFGIASVVWWHITDDLRPYTIAQFGPVLFLAPLAWKSRGVRALWPVAFFYGLAKAGEALDQEIYSLVPWSGHTIKHLLASLAVYCVFRWRTSLWSSTSSGTDSPNRSQPQDATRIAN